MEMKKDFPIGLATDFFESQDFVSFILVMFFYTRFHER